MTAENKKDILFSVLTLVLSAALLGRSFHYSLESIQFPRFLAILMLFFSALMLIKSIRSAKHTEGADEQNSSFSIQNFKIPAAVFGGTIAYVLCIQYLGYIVSTLVFLVGGMTYLGRHKIYVSLGSSLVFLCVVWALFIKFLGLRLPSGIIF